MTIIIRPFIHGRHTVSCSTEIPLGSFIAQCMSELEQLPTDYYNICILGNYGNPLLMMDYFRKSVVGIRTVDIKGLLDRGLTLSSVASFAEIYNVLRRWYSVFISVHHLGDSIIFSCQGNDISKDQYISRENGKARYPFVHH